MGKHASSSSGNTWKIILIGLYVAVVLRFIVREGMTTMADSNSNNSISNMAGSALSSIASQMSRQLPRRIHEGLRQMGEKLYRMGEK